MRIRSPSSHAGVSIRYSFFDLVLAAISPLLALYIRDAYILSPDGTMLVAIYWLVSFFCTLLAFAAFHIYGGIARYYSVHDVIDLAKAVLVSELLTCVVLFTVTRLEGIPRSTPAVHALILGLGLVTIRALVHLADKKRSLAEQPDQVAQQHIILIGVNDLSVLYMKFLEVGACGRQRVIALLDAEPRLKGRSVSGVRIFGPPSQLASLIEEFAIHGVRTDRVVAGGPADMLSAEELAQIRHVCVQRGLDFLSVPQLFDIGPPGATGNPDQPQVTFVPDGGEAAAIALPRYFRFKRAVDFVIALVLIVALLPLWVLVAGLAFIDVGSPIVFWQQRLGMNGRNFLLYKIRTLRPAFDRTDQPHDRRLSWIGRLLRKTRIDELPQLLNVLVGDMSLIGPRPLLPRDQPPIPTVRLMVCPGITGWAQVNGGALLSPKEKERFDEEYVRNASPWFDLRIAALTIFSLFRGDRRAERMAAQPATARDGASGEQKPGAPNGASSRFAATPNAVLQDEARVSVARSA